MILYGARLTADAGIGLFSPATVGIFIPRLAACRKFATSAPNASALSLNRGQRSMQKRVIERENNSASVVRPTDCRL